MAIAAQKSPFSSESWRTPCPPVPMRGVLSARPTAPLSGRFPGVFGAKLLTGPTSRSPKFALRRPFLSGPDDLADLVRNSKTKVKGRFPRGRRLHWFASHLPEKRTSRANTLVRYSAGRCRNKRPRCRHGGTCSRPSPPTLRRCCWAKWPAPSVLAGCLIVLVEFVAGQEPALNARVCTRPAFG